SGGTGRPRLQRFGSRAGALECRAGQEAGRVPTDALSRETSPWVILIDAHAQGPLHYVLQAAEASRRLDEAGREIKGAASAHKHPTGWEPTAPPGESRSRI